MVEKSEISYMLSLLSAYLTAEVETHNAENWESSDTIKLYECLQNAICSTHNRLCPNEEPLPRPTINPNLLLKK